MKQIILKSREELLSKLPELAEIPQEVSKFFAILEESRDNDRWIDVGRFFSVEYSDWSNSDGSYNKAIIKKNGDVISETQNFRYRGGHSDSLDNWDWCFKEVRILEENESSFSFGIRTRRSVKIFDFNGDKINLKLSYDYNNENKLKKQRDFLKGCMEDPAEFRNYVSDSLSGSWLGGWQLDPANGEYHDCGDFVLVFGVCYSKRGGGEAATEYQVFVLQKGIGVGISSIIETGLYNTRRDDVLNLRFKQESSWKRHHFKIQDNVLKIRGKYFKVISF